jgi:hypothetical protein
LCTSFRDKKLSVSLFFFVPVSDYFHWVLAQGYFLALGLAFS